jgi:hypothetical protein
VPEGDLNLGRENRDKSVDLIKKLHEARDRRLRLPLTKLPERYLRGDYAIVFNCSGGGGVLGNGKFSLSVECDLSGNLGHRGGESDQSGGIDNDKLPVLIETIHVVDDEKRIIGNIGPSIVSCISLIHARTWGFVMPCIFLSYRLTSSLVKGSTSKTGNSMTFWAFSWASSLEKCQTTWSRLERR